MTDVDNSGDALLEALIAVATPANLTPEVGDLVLVTSASTLDWERVGYLLSPLPPEPLSMTPIEVWSTGRRVVRWHNARVIRVGPPGLRLRMLPYPSDEEIAESRAGR